MNDARLWLTAVALIVLVLGAATSQARAAELDDAKIFIEINATDGDAGIQIFLDGEGWDQMKVFDPDGNEILDVEGKGSVGIQGITELALESAEPSFDEQPLEDLLALFPEGEYLFRGQTTEGETLTGEAELTHNLPMGPVQVFPIDGEEVEIDDLKLEWQLVADPPGSEIVGYEIVVERDEDPVKVFKADVSPTTTSITVPEEFLESGTPYKWEVLAVEASDNQTISEAEFETEDDDDD